MRAYTDYMARHDGRHSILNKFLVAIFIKKYYFCIMNNNRQPLISFIITCYNLPVEMLAECIDNILTLSLGKDEREIVLVDDGSDTSLTSLLDERGNEITYIRQTNKGISEARNTGLRVATGRYVQFVDGDDYLIPESYEQCLDIVRHEKPDMVLFKFTRTSPQHIRPTYKKASPVSGTQYMLNNNVRDTVCCYVFRKETHEGIWFTPGALYEDGEFTSQLILQANKIYDTDITAYYYRKRERSITTNKARRNIIKRLNDMEHVITRLDGLARTLPKEKEEALRRRVAQLTMDYIYNMVTFTRSKRQFTARIARLEAKGLFPLPRHNYTSKYTLFRIVSKNKAVRNVMSIILK